MSRSRKLVLLPLVLLAFVLGLVGDLAQHMDEMRAHVVCPEHGERIHVLSQATHAHAREYRATPDVDHDAGCQLAEMGPRPVPVLPPPVATVEAPFVSVPAPSAPALHAPPPRSPLEQAPKTSPPARA